MHQAIRFTAIATLIWSCPTFADNFFDAGGYYIPEQEISVAGYRIDWISLETVSYYNETLNYEQPKAVWPRAELLLTKAKNESKRIYRFRNPTIKRKGVTLKSAATPLGTVVINGHFLDTRGMFWNQADIRAGETPVFEGTVVIVRNGNQIFSTPMRFVYYEGH